MRLTEQSLSVWNRRIVQKWPCRIQQSKGFNTLHVTLNVILCLAEFFIQRLFFPDMLMKTNSHVTQRQTPCGSFPWGTLADGSFFPFLLHSFLPFPSLVHLLWPPWGFSALLCAPGSIGMVSFRFYEDMNEIGCSAWPPLHHLPRYSFAYSLNYSADLRDICTVKLSARFAKAAEQSVFFLVICSLYQR